MKIESVMRTKVCRWKKSAGFIQLGVLLLGFSGAMAGTLAAAGNPTGSQAIAKQVDAHFDDSRNRAEYRVDDAAYLNRVWLDLVGIRPTPEKIEAFEQSRDPHKRYTVVEQLLADRRFGRHWGRYWRDVILARRADDRALRLVSAGLAEAVAERMNRNDGWNKIASDFITASGDVRSHGETGLFLAQKGEPEGISAEVARIFLGVQIQCAQCHDHPTDDWKREQFHQLAAFFPRVGVRPIRNSQPRNFEVFSRTQKRPGGKGKNKKPLEHFMPDLANPESPGHPTKPIFFLTGHSLELGSTDQDRRKALAEWLTDPEENRWFARAYVNRIWTELVGQGFYDSVDDISEQYDCDHPEVLSLLAENFVATDYDTKWLFRTIMATAAYQSQGDEHTAQAPQPLRGETLFDNLGQVLEINRGSRGKTGKPQKLKARQFFQLGFFYDPSLPRDEINPTIPQALLMMNSPQLNRVLRGDQRGTMLGRLLAEETEDEKVIETLYIRCLGRAPTQQEQLICLEYIQLQDNRTEACEDILWSLLNTAEFRQRN